MGCGEDRANRRKHGIGFEDVRSLFEAEVDYLVIFMNSTATTRNVSSQSGRFVAASSSWCTRNRKTT